MNNFLLQLSPFNSWSRKKSNIDRYVHKFIKVCKFWRLFLAATAFVVYSSNGLAEQVSQILVMAENKRLEASICPHSMNRLAIANDRIAQVFGDEGAFESQSEENTGQVFIKPTAENSDKPLSITLITEQGKTQDLSLKPTAKSATTLILKHSDKAPSQTEGRFSDRPFADLARQSGWHRERGFSYQGQILSLLKQAVMGVLPLKEGDSLSRTSPEGYALSYHQSFESGLFIVHCFHLENTTQTSIVCEERAFYQPGDLALSLKARVLPVGGKTLLYVVRQAQRGEL